MIAIGSILILGKVGQINKNQFGFN